MRSRPVAALFIDLDIGLDIVKSHSRRYVFDDNH